MAKDLSKSLDKLRQSVRTLNAITEEANKAVLAVEKFLADTSIGISACVPIRTAEDPEDYCYLEYRRVGTRFRIAIVYGNEQVGENVKPWSEATREEKLESLQVLPDLLTEIADNADDRATKAMGAIKVVHEVLDSLEN